MTRRHLLFSSTALFGAVPGPEFDYVRLHVRTGEIVNSTMPHDAPILPGSLVKPFTALAYAATHGGRFPEPLVCKGCWGGRAHGKLDFVQALAVSCNFYFEELSLRVDAEQMRLTAAEYGLPAPPDEVGARIGLGRSWRMAPRAVLRAYLQIRHPAILEALRQCALTGTAKAVGRGLAKTGTAPCEHRSPMPGDGLAIVLWPAVDPREAILVREHGVPGAVAAKRLPALLPAQ